MNKVIASTQEQNTYSGIAMLSIWTAGVLLGGILVTVPVNKSPALRTAKYYSDMRDSSYDSHSDIFKTGSFAANMAIDELIGLFYEKILKSQEELERDFNSVYFKNAWNLYEN